MLKIAFMAGLCLVMAPSALSFAGASHGTAAAGPGSGKEMVACTEPRPEVCTQDYQPVCAVLRDGSFRTYSNGCSACSDPEVTGHREGACE
jgi:hypothetical protein